MRPGMILLAGVLAAGCSKAKPTGAGARDALLDAWRKGGLDPGTFAPATSPVGKDCAAGKIDKLDVLVCAFGSPDEAKQAADLGLAWVGDTTGSSQAHGSLVIAVADRHNADPHGKTIDKLFKLAPK